MQDTRYGMRGQPAMQNVHRNERNKMELGLPRFDGLACTSPTHHGLINIHSIHRFSLSPVFSSGGI